MRIRFLGHAAFLIISDRGTKIITDPYKPGSFDGGIGYDAITEPADIVTISHEHDDHNATDIKGGPEYVRGPGRREIKGITITGTEVFHDANGGRDRGKNTVFNLLVDGVNVVHLGDLGHPLSAADAGKIGNADIVLAPVGGFFTIDAATARETVGTLRPRIVVPMHYKTAKCGFPIAGVDDFASGAGGKVKRIDGELEIGRDTLPGETTVYVLKPTK